MKLKPYILTILKLQAKWGTGKKEDKLAYKKGAWHGYFIAIAKDWKQKP